MIANTSRDIAQAVLAGGGMTALIAGLKLDDAMAKVEGRE